MSANVSRIQIILDSTQAKTEAKAVSTEIDNIGKTAQRAGVSAAQGMTTLEREIQSNRQVMAQLRVGIAENRTEISSLTTAMKVLEDQARKESAEYVVLSERLAIVNAETRQLVNAQSLLGAETNVLTLQNKELAAANVVVAETSELSGRQMIVAAGAASRVAGAAIPGARAISSLAGAFSVATLGQFALVVGIGILIGELFKLGKAKEEVIKVDEDQLKLDLQRGDLNSRAIRTNADLVSAFRILASEQAKYEAGTKALKKELEDLGRVGNITNNFITQGGITHREVVKSSEDFQRKTGELNTALGEQEKVIKPVVEVLRFYRDTNRLSTEQTLEFAKTMHFSGEQIEFFRVQLGEATTAQERYNAAIQTQKAPGFNTEVTGKGFAQLVADTTENLKASIAAGDSINRAALSQQSPLNQIKRILQETTLTAKGYREELAKQPFEIQRGIAELEKISKGMKVFADNTKQAESAARSMDAFLSRLGEESTRATGKTTGDSFEQQIANIKARSQKLFDELAAMRSTNTAKRAAAERFIRIIQVEGIADINEKRTEAERQVQDKLEKLKVQAIENDDARHKAEIQVRLADDIRWLQSLGFSRQEAENKATLFQVQEESKYRANQLKEYHAFFVKQRQDREEQERLFLKNQAKIDFEIRSNRPGRAEAQAEQIRADADALTTVREAFGQTNQFAREFDQILDRIAKNGAKNIDIVGESVAALAKDIFSVANLATFIGNAIGNAFEAAISGTDSFGHALTKAILNFIAQIAQQFGALFILIGSGFIFLGYPGGAALIGYGIALLALSGVLRGLANRIGQDKQTPQEQVAGAKAGGTATGRPEPTPNVIAFPTSSSARGSSQAIVLHMDRKGVKDAMSGEGAVFVDDLTGSGQNSSMVSKRIKKLAS